MGADLRFGAMGTRAHVLIEGAAPEHVALAMSRVRELDSRWSRFRPSSEISALNRARGAAVAVSADTVELVQRSIDAFALTGGAFDPSLHDAIVAAGYDRDLADLPDAPHDGGATAPPPPGGPGPHGLAVDPDARTAAAGPRGIDSGGLGKGLAADLAVRDLLAAGASGALVNLGGDLRCSGTGPAGGWTVALDDPYDATARPIGRLSLEAGAVATSSQLVRRWYQGRRQRHHLLDPRTGAPSASDVAAVTVLAATGWEAEALAKAAFLAGAADALEVLAARGATGVVADLRGRIRVGAGLDGRLRLRGDLRRRSERRPAVRVAAGDRRMTVRLPAARASR